MACTTPPSSRSPSPTSAQRWRARAGSAAPGPAAAGTRAGARQCGRCGSGWTDKRGSGPGLFRSRSAGWSRACRCSGLTWATVASEHGFARCGLQSGLGPADPMARDLVLADPGELTAGQFGRLQQIYEESFPSELRVPVAELAAAGPRDRMLVALQGGEPEGFAVLR